MTTNSGISLLLRLAAAGVCLGLAATALFYDLPLRALLWDEQWWGWFAAALGYDWKEWVTSPLVDQWIVYLIKGLGGVLGASGLLLLWQPRPKLAVGAASFILLIQHFLQWKTHFWQIGQLLELGLQTAAPALLLGWLFLSDEARKASANVVARNLHRFWFVVRLLIAATFIGHGLYAVGIYPVPAAFILMTQAGLGVTEAVARNLLVLVGILDFLAAIVLLLPGRKPQLIALGWIIPWAILTSLARLWSYGGLVTVDTLLWQWLPELVRRLPHVLIPLALWRALRAS